MKPKDKKEQRFRKEFEDALTAPVSEERERRRNRRAIKRRTSKYARKKGKNILRQTMEDF